MTVLAQQPDAAAPPPPPISRLRSRAATTARFVLRQWLIIGIAVGCVLGYFFPNVAKHGGTIRSQYSILYAAVGVIFFVSGLGIATDKLLLHLRNWRLHLLVQATSFLVFPALLLAVVHIIVAADTTHTIDRAVLAGYIFIACLPTTISSNVVMTRAAHGDDAAALVEVVIANVLGPFISPGWTMALLPHTADFAPFRGGHGHGQNNMADMYRDVFKQLGISVLAPLAVGQVVRLLWNEQSVWCMQTFRLQKVSTACLILLIWSSFSTCFATDAFQTISSQCVAFIVLFNIALYLLMSVVCFGLCRPPKGVPFLRPTDPRITIAVCFCGPAKTTALGIPLIHAMWKTVDLHLTAKASLPVLLYTTEQVFVAHFIVHVFKAWLRRREPPPNIESGPDSAGEAVEK